MSTSNNHNTSEKSGEDGIFVDRLSEQGTNDLEADFLEITDDDKVFFGFPTGDSMDGLPPFESFDSRLIDDKLNSKFGTTELDGSEPNPDGILSRDNVLEPTAKWEGEELNIEPYAFRNPDVTNDDGDLDDAASDDGNRFGDMKQVFDIFRDDCDPGDIKEDPLQGLIPTIIPNMGIKMSPVKTQKYPTIATVVTYPEGEDDTSREVTEFSDFEGFVEQFSPSPCPEAWVDQKNSSNTPAFPLGAPKAIFHVESNLASEVTKHKHWTEEEDEQLRGAVLRETAHGERHDWKKIAKTYFGNTRSGTQCKVRWKNHLKPGIKRGKWEEHEDRIILFMMERGKKWSEIAHRLPGRIGENVRERYVNVLDPNLKKTPWTPEEDTILFENQAILGNRWSAIRKLIPGRSENSIKNRYHNRKNAYLRKLKREAEEREMREAGIAAPWDSTAV